jgi:predicted O-methyltransferase YrrM
MSETMPKPTEFGNFFDQEAAPQLGLREKTFRHIFEYLDQISHPLTIVETGCARRPGNWQDGQSTLLFDKYICSRDLESVVYSVDINPDNLAEAKKLVGPRIRFTQDDSVKFLRHLTGRLLAEGKTIDMLYLDSFDLDWVYWYPSATHHLKELCAAMRVIRSDTLVAVDDCALNGLFVQDSPSSVHFVIQPIIGGKGRLIAEYATACGAKLEFSGYQAGWSGF